MEIGIVGKPNVGKSTFFAAATLAPAQIANYPFTTIEPNRGVAYVRARCPHVDIGTPCNPNNSQCIGGTRLIPVEMIDVAGLVPGAHEGRGLGNKFLDDLRQASALVHIVDASGGTDAEGQPCPIGSHDPMEDVGFLEEEIAHWIRGILEKDWKKISRQAETEEKKIERLLHERLTGLGLSEAQVAAALRAADLPPKFTGWGAGEMQTLAMALRAQGKPMLIAANKHDIAPPSALERMTGRVVPTSAEFELALRRASKAGIVEYIPGEAEFKILDRERLNPAQAKALEKIAGYLERHGSTGVQRCIETAVYEMLGLMVVYPVEDEHKYTDKQGRVLPDAYLVPQGSTARDLAYKVHTDLGEHFIRAIDARTKRVIGQDYRLKEGDVITIVARG
ncbi:MAG: redox-regulated ATPase YchF [Candidatus Thermoplasmatota archaeon]